MINCNIGIIYKPIDSSYIRLVFMTEYSSIYYQSYVDKINFFHNTYGCNSDTYIVSNYFKWHI